MAQAFVFVNTELGMEEQAIEEIKGIEVVKEVYMAYGVYDLVLRIQAPSLETLKRSILAQIRELSSVRSTMSMIVAENIS